MEILPVKWLLAASLTALSFPLPAGAEAPFRFDSTPGQLPKTVTPTSYVVDIVPDPNTLTLTGHETIDLTVRTSTDKMVLNDIDLAIADAKLDGSEPATVALDTRAQTATLSFAHPVPPGPHRIELDFRGTLKDTPAAGLYYDDYKTEGGSQKRMLVSQFEVADARRMFPCWDEPVFKATFRLSAVLPADFTAISNMPIESRTPAGAGRTKVQFATTPRMSTYLLALVAGDMRALDGHAANTAMHAYAPAGEQDQAGYALSVEQKVLPYYNEYFGVPFPLPKLDLIAIPGNYAAGAMENWGAITFVDSTMLFDPTTSDARTRETIHIDVAHEMAHQWSGDLVTMAWWNDIWLNEGFATWMQFKATDHFNPSWEIWPRQHAAREAAMGQDAVPSTHAIEQPIHDVSQANSAFDVISYQKGSQVIRMIEDWIGPDVFRDGMRRYMKAHAYSSTTSADLWAALSAASGKNVAAVANTFTSQPGIPLVVLSRQCDHGTSNLTLAQERFTIHDPHPAPLHWLVPVTIGVAGRGPVQRILLDGKASLSLPGCDTPVKANWGENGYYRTQYDAPSLQSLAAHYAALGPADRANLLGDQFELFVADRQSLADYLNLLPALKAETDIAVWTDTLNRLRTLDRLTRGTPTRAPFRAYAQSLIAPEFARIGWDAKPGESFLDALLRPELIQTLGQLGDPQVIAEADRRFAAFRQNPSSLAPNLREPVLAIVAHHASAATYDLLRKMGEQATSTEEKTRYFAAMASAEDPTLIARTVKYLEGDQVPSNSILRVVFSASMNSDNPDTVWADVQKEGPAIRRKLAPLTQDILLPAAAMGSSNPEVAEALRNDPLSNDSAGARIWAARALDAIGTQVELKNRAQPALAAWLSANGAG